jgi:hypothetical protein
MGKVVIIVPVIVDVVEISTPVTITGPVKTGTEKPVRTAPVIALVVAVVILVPVTITGLARVGMEKIV